MTASIVLFPLSKTRSRPPAGLGSAAASAHESLCELAADHPVNSKFAFAESLAIIAGHASMHAEGRTDWTRTDYVAACEAYAAAIGMKVARS